MEYLERKKKPSFFQVFMRTIKDFDAWQWYDLNPSHTLIEQLKITSNRDWCSNAIFSFFKGRGTETPKLLLDLYYQRHLVKSGLTNDSLLKDTSGRLKRVKMDVDGLPTTITEYRTLYLKTLSE